MLLQRSRTLLKGKQISRDILTLSIPFEWPSEKLLDPGGPSILWRGWRDVRHSDPNASFLFNIMVNTGRVGQEQTGMA